jgi:tRNA-dihydrouridine synthase
MAKKQLESVNDNVLAELTIEELEERLETQILRAPEAACSWSCDAVCDIGYDCGQINVGCPQHCSPQYCGQYCS